MCFYGMIADEWSILLACQEILARCLHRGLLGQCYYVFIASAGDCCWGEAGDHGRVGIHTWACPVCDNL